MKKISFKLNSVSNALEIYDFLKSLSDLSSSYYILLDRNVVEICGIPDPEIEKVIQILTNFFSIGIVYDCIDLEKYGVVKPRTSTKKGNELLMPALESPELNALATKFVENLHSSSTKQEKLVDYLNNCINDLSPYLHILEKPVYAVGNIVRLNSTSEFYFEFNSMNSFVYALICNVPNQKTACIVPIIPKKKLDYPGKMIPIGCNDITPNLNSVKQPMAMLEYVRYVSTDKIEGICALASPSLQKKVIEGLATVFNFVTYPAPSELPPAPPKTYISVSKEEALENVFESTLACIPKTGTKREKVEKLLALIDYPQDNLSTDTFLAAYNVEKITYGSIVYEIQKQYSYSHDSALNSIKLTFTDWLAKHPEIKEACPKLSLITMLKFFISKL